MDYVALLWGERVNEKLVKTINPLNEVEVHFDNPAGGFDTHFLEFDFNRVKSEGSLSHLLVTVNDVTKRVMLSRELQESQEKAQAQLDLLLRILHVEPDSLTGFLTDADVSLKMVNSILKEPAREESAFRAKIDGIYRQVHAVKGESAALGLKTVEQRAHAFEESLNDLKGRADAVGQRLPAARRQARRSVQPPGAGSRNAESTGRPAPGDRVASHGRAARWKHRRSMPGSRQAVSRPCRRRHSSLPQRRRERYAASIARSKISRRASPRASRSRWRVKCNGLESRAGSTIAAPSRTSRFSWCATQSCTASKTPDERVARQQVRDRHARRRIRARGNEGFELIVQDDGRGLQLDRIKEVAVERGLITPAQAAMLDPRQTMALIFRPGFSTADRVTTDAGRGAGMDLVRILVAELGGRVGLASAGGRFSKFKIWLPATERAVAA